MNIDKFVQKFYMADEIVIPEIIVQDPSLSFNLHEYLRHTPENTNPAILLENSVPIEVVEYIMKDPTIANPAMFDAITSNALPTGIIPKPPTPTN